MDLYTEVAQLLKTKGVDMLIGITGSNGKTIVKEWLYQMLSPDYNIVRSPKSYNSQVGVPLSVWQTNENNELAIFEAGISEPDEMMALQDIIRPTIGVFTNIGQAHEENFINRAQKVGEKMNLFTKAESLVYCMDYSEIQQVVIRSGMASKVKLFTWSRKFDDADLFVTEVTMGDKQTQIPSRMPYIASPSACSCRCSPRSSPRG